MADDSIPPTNLITGDDGGSSCSCDDRDSSFDYGEYSNDADDEAFDWMDADNLAFYLGLLAAFGSVLAYFIQRNVERHQEIQAEKEKLEDIDRQQALDRVRRQLSIFVGPLHRLIKTHNSFLMQYRIAHNIDLWPIQPNGKWETWMQFLPNEYLDVFIEDPTSLEARQYRSAVINRWKPIYTQIRELVLKHLSELADMPGQEEYLEKWEEEKVMSPYVGSINVNVIFDTYTVWAYEFDDLIESWKLEDYSRMQPTTKVPWLICNYLVDYLYDNAKTKEATYNKHVKVHKNIRQDKKNTLLEISTRIRNNADKDVNAQKRNISNRSFNSYSESSTTSSKDENNSPWILPDTPSLELAFPTPHPQQSK